MKKGRSSREAERAAAKHDKSRTALRQSDSVYQSSVAEAEESRQGRYAAFGLEVDQLFKFRNGELRFNLLFKKGI